MLFYELIPITNWKKPRRLKHVFGAMDYGRLISQVFPARFPMSVFILGTLRTIAYPTVWPISRIKRTQRSLRLQSSCFVLIFKIRVCYIHPEQGPGSSGSQQP